MNITFTGSNIEITEALKNFTEDKLQKIEHRQHIEDINVALNVEHVTHSAAANVLIDTTNLHASAKADDMYAAIDALIAKLIVLITKHKDKTTHH